MFLTSLSGCLPQKLHWIIIALIIASIFSWTCFRNFSLILLGAHQRILLTIWNKKVKSLPYEGLQSGCCRCRAEIVIARKLINLQRELRLRRASAERMTLMICAQITGVICASRPRHDSRCEHCFCTFYTSFSGLYPRHVFYTLCVKVLFVSQLSSWWMR